MKYRFFSAIVLALAVATIVACGKSSPTTPSTNGAGTTTVSTPGTPGSGTGQLRVSLKDSPFSDAKAVMVTFSEMSVHASGGDWKSVPFKGGGTLTCNLKQLEDGAMDLLGEQPLAAGHYTQIRLTVQSATLYFAQAVPENTPPCNAIAPALTGSSAPLTIPSGELKLNREFDLPAGAKMSVLLDFDGDKSIHATGNGKYQMSPVISVVSVE